jgi:hypothetical protein
MSSGPDWLLYLPYRSIPGQPLCSLGLLDRLARTFLEYRDFRDLVNLVAQLFLSIQTRCFEPHRAVEEEIRYRAFASN